MGIIKKPDLKRLASFKKNEALVISLYLNVDGAKYPSLQDYEKELHGLLHRAEHEWLGGAKKTTKSKKQSLGKDLKKIDDFVTGQWHRRGIKGLVIFSCVAVDFWQVVELPVAVPSALIIGSEPFTKTLTAALDEYKRFCVIGVDRKKARFFTVYLGEIEEHHGVLIDERVPDQVKEGEWAGLRQSRIARHIEDHVMQHLREIADLAFNFFHEHSFDRLILVGQKELLPKFISVLHPYLQERIAGEVNIAPDMPLEEILQKSLSVEKEIQHREEADLVHKLKEENRPGGLGVVGLRPTVDALMKGQARTLLIGEDYSTPGYICYKDHYLSTSVDECPVCGESLVKSGDLVEDMVQVAINQNVQIEHITYNDEFTGRDRVGALLRFAS